MENDQVFAADGSIDSNTRAATRTNYGSLNQGQYATVAAGGISPERAAEEQTPLLSRKPSSPGAEDDTAEAPAWTGDADFAHLPWWKRPSIYWIIIPFFVFATAFGGIIVPKVNLILFLICDDYYSDRARREPGFTFVPIIVGGENPECQTKEISALTARFTLYMSLLSGLICAVTAPILGAYSDRHGRLKVIAISSAGLLASEFITIMVARNFGTISINWILVGYALDGLTGSFIAGMAITHAYASDCTPPDKRAVAFGYFHGALFTGIAVGPILAGKVVAYTKDLLVPFYIAAGAHVFFILFVLFVIPESLTKERQFAARQKRRALREITLQAALANPDTAWFIPFQRVTEIVAPLKILWPTGPGSSAALRRNLIFLALVDTIIFGVAMGVLTVVVLYSELAFKWKTEDTSTFISIANIGRVTVLFAVMPLLSRLLRGKAKKDKSSTLNRGSDRVDLILIQVSILFDVLGYVGYATVKTPGLFIASALVAAGGAIASPTVESSMTRHVPPDRVGQILGAVGLLHALGRIAGPAIFNLIYEKTVVTVPQTVFIVIAAFFGAALILSFFLRTNVYFEEPLRPSTADSSTRDE